MHVDCTYVSRNVAKARISCCNFALATLYLVACGIEVSTWFPLIRNTRGVKFLPTLIVFISGALVTERLSSFPEMKCDLVATMLQNIAKWKQLRHDD